MYKSKQEGMNMKCKHPEESIETFIETNHGDYIYFCKECGSEVTKVTQYEPDLEADSPTICCDRFEYKVEGCNHPIAKVHTPGAVRYDNNPYRICGDCGIKMRNVYLYITRGNLNGYRHEEDIDYESDPLTDGSGPGSWEAGRVDYTDGLGEPAQTEQQ